jgi:RNA polymerase sigma-32 factor
MSYMPSNIQVEPSLRSFVSDAKRFPMLTPERELEIATAWHDRGDRAAREELTRSHLRLVVKIARGFKGYGLPLADLVAEGNIGLLHAIDKFEPQRGFRFATYAVWWIRASIQAYILRSWSLVKIGTTGAQKRLFFNLRRLKLQLQDPDKDGLLPETASMIATKLNVRESDVAEMDERLSAPDNSLNAHLAGDASTEWIDLLPDDRPDQETVVGEADEHARRHTLLKSAMARLGPREREIIVERRFKEKPVTLRELSDRYSLSPERVRQIEVRAIEKLRVALGAPSSKTGIRVRELMH